MMLKGPKIQIIYHPSIILYIIGFPAQKLSMKDFHLEIRAHMDVQKFLKDAVIQLDVDATNTADLLRGMLGQILARERANEVLDMAIAECFSQDCGKQNLPSNSQNQSHKNII